MSPKSLKDQIDRLILFGVMCVNPVSIYDTLMSWKGFLVGKKWKRFGWHAHYVYFR